MKLLAFLVSNNDFASWFKKYYFIVIIVLVVIIASIIVLICVKKKKRKKAIENGMISKYIDPKDIATADDLKHIKTKSLNEKVEMYKGYCRYQDDNQEYIKRSDEQQKIYDEYFVVKNLRTITCDPKKRKISDLFKIIKIVCFILSGLCIVSGLILLTLIIIGLVFLILGITSLILQKVFLKKFNSSLEQTDGPEKIIIDSEYEALVDNKIIEMDILNIGISKLGLDSEKTENVDSIIIRDKVMDDKSLYVYTDNDNSLHSSKHFAALFVFMSKKLYVYKVQFDMCNSMKEEWMNEFDYKDICDCSLYTKKVIKKTYENELIEYDLSTFRIVGTNSEIEFDCYNEKLFNEIRNKIREKK